MSITMRFGLERRAISIASLPFEASSTFSMSGSFSRMARTAQRILA